MVKNVKAESSEFATLKVSWEPLPITRSDKPEFQINNYKLVLHNLAPRDSESSDPMPIEVPGGASALSFVILGLQPDSFYKIRVMAVSKLGIEGHPAIVSSSPRIISRPPSGTPTNVRTAVQFWILSLYLCNESFKGPCVVGASCLKFPWFLSNSNASFGRFLWL